MKTKVALIATCNLPEDLKYITKFLNAHFAVTYRCEGRVSSRWEFNTACGFPQKALAMMTDNIKDVANSSLFVMACYEGSNNCFTNRHYSRGKWETVYNFSKEEMSKMNPQKDTIPCKNYS